MPYLRTAQLPQLRPKDAHHAPSWLRMINLASPGVWGTHRCRHSECPFGSRCIPECELLQSMFKWTAHGEYDPFEIAVVGLGVLLVVGVALIF